MATTTEEIAIRLGIKNADLKAALADSSADIKKFKKAGESTNDDGILGTIKKSTKALRDFREIFLGGALAGAVVGFFRLAIDAAEKNTDKTNENARAVRDFAAALSELKGTAGTVAVTVVGFFNRIGEAIGDVINAQIAMAKGGRDGLEAWSKNRDLIEATGKAALEAEQRLAEVRKKNGAEFLAITKELASIEEKAREQKLKGLDVYETEKNILKALGDAQLKLRDYEGDAIGRRRLVLEVAKLQLSADDASLAVRKDQVGVEEKIKETKKKAAEEEKKRAEEEAKEFADLSARRALAYEEELELTILQAKAADKLTDSERARLKILEQAKILNIAEVQLKDLIEKKAREGLTPAEVALVVELQKQVDKLRTQLGLKTLINTTTDNQLPAEQAITTEMEQQAIHAKIIADEKDRAAQIDRSRSGTVTTTGNIKNLNEIQLDAVIQKINQQLGPIKSSDAQFHGPGQPVGTYKSVEQYILQNQLDQAVAERNLRREFQQTLNNFGDSRAQQLFAPDDYARLLQLFNPDQAKKDSNNIAIIAYGLQSLIPEKFNGAIR